MQSKKIKLNDCFEVNNKKITHFKVKVLLLKDEIKALDEVELLSENDDLSVREKEMLAALIFTSKQIDLDCEISGELLLNNLSADDYQKITEEIGKFKGKSESDGV